MSDALTAFPIEEADIPAFASYAEAKASGRLARIWLGSHPGYRKAGLVRAREEFAFLIPGGRLVVLDHLCIALTPEGGYLPASFPKDWPFQRYSRGERLALPVAAAAGPPRPGDWVCPFTEPDHDHLFHSLLDNYGRLAWMSLLRIDLPILYPSLYEASPRRAAIAKAFLGGSRGVQVEAGVHACERLLVPPPGNRDDYFYPPVVEFLRARLCAAFARERYTHPTRLFVSRADTPMRNLVNEADLIAALRTRGFAPLCPGDYTAPAQFEQFAAAEAIVGLHGNGLTPMLTARNCRRFVEIEPIGWSFTAYSAIAAALGMDYQRVGAEMLPSGNDNVVQWLARIDVNEALAALEGY